MKAMLLAAGAGTRLQPLTDTVPKPLAPIANVPLLFRTLEWLAWEGVDEVVINVHHLAQQIVFAVDDGSRFGVRAHFSIEEELLGTSGAVRRCAEHFRDEPFFVIYGDNLIDADLSALRSFHVESHAEATIALFTPDNPSSVGMVETDRDGRVGRFVEKPKPGEAVSATMANAGIYMIEPHLLETLPNGFSDFGNQIFPAWLAEGRAVHATPLKGYLKDTGTPERYREANWDLLADTLRHPPMGQRIGSSLVSVDADIYPSAQLIGRNIIASGSVIATNTRLEECIVWPGATIEPDANLRGVIVGSGAVVPAGTEAEGVILV